MRPFFSIGSVEIGKTDTHLIIIAITERVFQCRIVIKKKGQKYTQNEMKSKAPLD